MSIPASPPLLYGVIGEAADTLPIEAETPSGSGALSYKHGWPAVTAMPLEAGGVAPQREYFNAVNKLLSQHVAFQQAGAVYPWSATLDYPVNAKVEGSDGEVYVALKPSGPDTPDAAGTGMVGPVDPVGDEGGHWIALRLLYGGMPNDEEWILESGTWTAKMAGWHEVTVWHGGYGGWWSLDLNRGGGGNGMAPKTYLAWYAEGDEVPVVIGAGGKGTAANGGFPEAARGGITTFGDLTTAYDANHLRINAAYLHSGLTASNATYISGEGAGGGNASAPEAGEASYYGAGGAVCFTTGQAPSVTDGYQGAVLIRRHNPALASGPLATPAFFAAPRKARAATTTAKVNLYDPETGQGSVWREEDAPAKLAEGLVTQEAWLEKCAAKAAEERAAWLADPETVAERFTLLRAAREAKLAETDYLVAPDYPLSEEQRAEVTAYRQALRDLPAQAGAPWDGGGKATPWPALPEIVKA